MGFYAEPAYIKPVLPHLHDKAFVSAVFLTIEEVEKEEKKAPARFKPRTSWSQACDLP